MQSSSVPYYEPPSLLAASELVKVYREYRLCKVFCVSFYRRKPEENLNEPELRPNS